MKKKDSIIKQDPFGAKRETEDFSKTTIVERDFNALWALLQIVVLKFIYSVKATKFCEISTVDLTGTTYDKSMVKILQNFVAFSENMNFTLL